MWIPDGNVAYFRGKHVPPILVASLIILTGILYTILLFSWQWLDQISDWKSFKWTRNTRLNGFLNTFHAPYVSKCHYWTGLLLMVRVIYITSAITLSSNCNPQIPLIAIIVLVVKWHTSITSCPKS